MKSDENLVYRGESYSKSLCGFSLLGKFHFQLMKSRASIHPLNYSRRFEVYE